MTRPAAYLALIALLVTASAGPCLADGATAYAVPLTGITVDGQLDDWPAGMAVYPIAWVSPVYKPTPPDGPQDLTASFRVGYDAAADQLYLGVTVRDDQVVTRAEGAAYHNQDLCEVYVDADRSGHDVSGPGSSGGAQQYCMVPGPGRVSDAVPVDANPALAGGDAKVSGVQGVFRRADSTTTYEWAIPLFEHFPDRPFQVRTGATIGFDVAVCDADGEEPGNWVAWSPGIGKVSDSSLFGRLTLIESYAELGRLAGTLTATGEEGGPLADRAIEVYRDTALAASVRTDPQGHYEVLVPAGTYAVRLGRGQGYRPAAQAGVTAVAGQTVVAELAAAPVKVPKALRQAAAVYAALGTYCNTTTTEMHVVRPGMDNRMAFATSLSFARPNRLRHQGGMGPGMETILVCDGQMLTTYQGMLKQYTQAKAPDTLTVAALQGGIGMPGAGGSPSAAVQMLLSRDPLQEAMKGVEDVREVGEERWNGVPADVLVFTQPAASLAGGMVPPGAGAGSVEVRVWIGKRRWGRRRTRWSCSASWRSCWGSEGTGVPVQAGCPGGPAHAVGGPPARGDKEHRKERAPVNGRRLAAVGAVALALSGPAAGQTLFADVTDSVFATPPPGSRGQAWGDYDNDGWVDLLAGADIFGASVWLWGNEGGTRFGDRSAAVGSQAGPGAKGGGTVFGDYDNDGDLDVYVPVGSYGPRSAGLNLLLRNDRGVFTNVNRAAGLTDSLPTDNALWLDWDRDGYLDLYTGNLAAGNDDDADPTNDSDPTVRNKLYRNQGDGTFADVTAAAGLDVPLHRQAGGSNGGMAAADFSDDGWPDLYVGVYGDRDRLFLSDGRGRFRDATTDEIGDEGLAWDVAVGDFDNDGDLDLLTARPHRLFRNDGGGFFTEDTARLGMAGEVSLSLADYDRDGFLDAFLGWRDMASGGLYRNRGNGNHWLEVEVAGVQSNRSGIGARLIATAGPLRQIREILGGAGCAQDEMMAHFGLGESTQVDELEVRWPSGQVDGLAGVPADQRIRVVEGQVGYWVVQPTTASLTDTLVAGVPADFALRVQPAPFDAAARVTRVVADLGSIGGGPEMPLQPDGESGYALRVALAVPGANGLQAISVLIEQETRLGHQWSRLGRTVVVVPATDAVIYGGGLDPGWRVEGFRMEGLDMAAAAPGRPGARAAAHQGKSGGWRVVFDTSTPVPSTGYRLHLAFHPGRAVLAARRPA
ncbi:MAG: FG-GAP-like repeat-containing protein, partial [Candidatus Latescibacterota bacterium]